MPGWHAQRRQPSWDSLLMGWAGLIFARVCQAIMMGLEFASCLLRSHCLPNFIPHAFRQLPCVSCSKNEHVAINFGAQQFRFNLQVGICIHAGASACVTSCLVTLSAPDCLLAQWHFGGHLAAAPRIERAHKLHQNLCTEVQLFAGAHTQRDGTAAAGCPQVRGSAFSLMSCSDMPDLLLVYPSIT